MRVILCDICGNEVIEGDLRDLAIQTPEGKPSMKPLEICVHCVLKVTESINQIRIESMVSNVDKG